MCEFCQDVYLLISTLFAHPFVCFSRKKTNNKTQNKHKVPSFRWWNVSTSHESSAFAARCCQRLTTMLSLLLGRSHLGVGNSLKWTARLSSLKIGRNCPKKDMNHLNQPSTCRGFAVSFREGRSKWVFSLFFFVWNQKNKKISVLARFSFLLLGELNE